MAMVQVGRVYRLRDLRFRELLSVDSLVQPPTLRLRTQSHSKSTNWPSSRFLKSLKLSYSEPDTAGSPCQGSLKSATIAPKSTAASGKSTAPGLYEESALAFGSESESGSNKPKSQQKSKSKSKSNSNSGSVAESAFSDCTTAPEDISPNPKNNERVEEWRESIGEGTVTATASQDISPSGSKNPARDAAKAVAEADKQLPEEKVLCEDSTWPQVAEAFIYTVKFFEQSAATNPKGGTYKTKWSCWVTATPQNVMKRYQKIPLVSATMECLGDIYKMLHGQIGDIDPKIRFDGISESTQSTEVQP